MFETKLRITCPFNRITNYNCNLLKITIISIKWLWCYWSTFANDANAVAKYNVERLF